MRSLAKNEKFLNKKRKTYLMWGLAIGGGLYILNTMGVF